MEPQRTIRGSIGIHRAHFRNHCSSLFHLTVIFKQFITVFGWVIIFSEVTFCLSSTLGSNVWSVNLINWLHLIPSQLLTPCPCPMYAAMAYNLDKWTVLYFNSSVFYLCLMIATILRITQHLYFVHFVWMKNKHNSVAITKQNWSHWVKGNGLDPETSCSLFRIVQWTRSTHTTIWSVTPHIPMVEHLEKLRAITMNELRKRRFLHSNGFENETQYMSAYN